MDVNQLTDPLLTWLLESNYLLPTAIPVGVLVIVLVWDCGERWWRR